MCGNSNPTPTPTPESEKKVVTREFLADKLAAIEEKAGRAFALTPFGSAEENAARQAMELTQRLRSELATMHFVQPEQASQSLRELLSTISLRLQAAQEKAHQYYRQYSYPADRGFLELSNDLMQMRLEVLAAAEAVGNSATSNPVPDAPAAPFDLTEEQEEGILEPDLEELDGLSSALIRLYSVMPKNTRLRHVLDALSDAAIHLEHRYEDEDSDDDKNSISESMKDKVLSKLEGLSKATSTPIDRAMKLLDALSELYQEAAWHSDLEEMAESLSEVAQDLAAALEKSESESKPSSEPTNVEIKLLLNGVEIPLKRA